MAFWDKYTEINTELEHNKFKGNPYMSATEIQIAVLFLLQPPFLITFRFETRVPNNIY